MRGVSLVLAAVAAAIVSSAGLAQQGYPSKPVRLIIPFPPGGSNDVVGRMFGQQLGDRLGQSVIIENRGGAGGTIGTDAAAKSAPDGYTLLLVSIAYSFSPAMYKSLPYDPAKAFTPVAPIGAGPAVLVVHPGVPIKTAKELVTFTQAKPGALRIASAGIGSFQHLAGELFRLQGKAEMLHIPYKGGGPAMTDVLGGHAEVMMGSLIQTIQHIRTGKLRALGVTGSKRNPAMPQVPTMEETGLKAVDVTSVWGVHAPAGTPLAIRQKVRDAFAAVMAAPEMTTKLNSLGYTPLGITPEEHQAMTERIVNRWVALSKKVDLSD